MSETTFKDLATPRFDDTYPATDLIHNLLQYAGADVSAFRRNCQVSYRLVEYARDLYDEINKLIHTAETSGRWEDYEKYHGAIDPLEELLLKIVDVTVTERDQYLLPVVEGTALKLFKEYIQNWVDQRKTIRDYLDKIRNDPPLKNLITPAADKGQEINSAKDQDDQALLQNLLDGTNGNLKSVTREKIKLKVMDVNKSLQSVLDLQKAKPPASLGEELNILAIKCAMIVYGVTQLMSYTTDTNSELHDQLHSDPIWDAAQELATKLHEYLQSDGTLNFSALDEMYKNLEEALEGKFTVDMPQAYHDLFKLVGKIGRAYHAQSIFLASHCHKAASKFKGEDKKSYEARDALEDALVQTVLAFQSAGGKNKQSQPSEPKENGKPKENGAMPNGATPKGSEDTCATLYKESVDKIVACFTKMQIDGTQLTADFESARAKDENRVEEAKKRLGEAIPSKPTLIDISLELCDEQKDNVSKTLNVKVLKTARLSYIKWIVASELQSAGNVHFEGPAEPRELSLDTQISDLVKDDNKYTLYLIIRK